MRRGAWALLGTIALASACLLPDVSELTGGVVPDGGASSQDATTDDGALAESGAGDGAVIADGGADASDDGGDGAAPPLCSTNAVFCTDFENAQPFFGWGTPLTAGCTVVASTAQAISPTHSAEFSFFPDGGHDTCRLPSTTFPVASTHLSFAFDLFVPSSESSKMAGQAYEIAIASPIFSFGRIANFISLTNGQLTFGLYNLASPGDTNAGNANSVCATFSAFDRWSHIVADLKFDPQQTRLTGSLDGVSCNVSLNWTPIGPPTQSAYFWVTPQRSNQHFFVDNVVVKTLP